MNTVKPMMIILLLMVLVMVMIAMAQASMVEAVSNIGPSLVGFALSPNR